MTKLRKEFPGGRALLIGIGKGYPGRLELPDVVRHDAEALGAWWAETNPADGHPRTWVRGLAEFAADVCADGSPILASFRAAGGGK